MKAIKIIVVYLIILIFLFSHSLFASEESRSINFANLSPQLAIPREGFQQIYLNAQPSNSENKDIVINSFEQELFDAVKQEMFLLNKAGLDKYRFDSNARFFNKYSLDPDVGDISDPLSRIEKYQGGICLEQCVSLQRDAYRLFLSQEFLGDIAKGKTVEMEVVKAFDENYEYEVKILFDRQEYRIKGYIIGAIAGDEYRKLNLKESEFLEIMHYASMTKVVLPTQEEKIIVHEPAWAIAGGINFQERVAGKGGLYYLEHTTSQQLAEYMQLNKELDWLNQAINGKNWMEKIREKGITLFVQNKSKTAMRYIFIDQPFNSRDTDKFHERDMMTGDARNQNIIRTDADGNRLAMAQISMNDDYLSMKLYIADLKREVLLEEDLNEIHYEIKQRQIVYSEKTLKFLKCGAALGMVTEQQMGIDADKSEFFKRLEVLIDQGNRAHFLGLIRQWQEDGVESSNFAGAELALVGSSI